MSKKKQTAAWKKKAEAAPKKKKEIVLSKKAKIITAIIAVVIALVLAFFIIRALTRSNAGGSSATPGVLTEQKVVKPLISKKGVSAVSDSDKLRHVEIEVKDYGVIYLALDETVAPLTVQNFIELAESGFYNGLTFHRIMNGFMMQGGCPDGTGNGDAGYYIAGEFETNGYNNPISHTRGVISMARRSGEPNSAGSQFFIMQKDNTTLDGNYAAFGWVTAGIEVVDAICSDAKPLNDNGAIAKEEQPVITSVSVID